MPGPCFRGLYPWYTAGMCDSEDTAAEPTYDEVIDTLRLAMISGVGPRIRHALLEKFGSPQAVLAAAPSELGEVPGVGPKLVGRITAAGDEIDVEREIALCWRPPARNRLENGR